VAVVEEIRMKIYKPLKIILLSLVVLAVLYQLLLYYIWYPQKGIRYIFPDNYRGWVCVTYDAKDAPPLSVEDGFLLLKIPKNGVVKTSSLPNNYSKEGYYIPTYDEYYYDSASGIEEAKELAMGGGYTVQKEGEKEFTSYFWISTKEKIDEDYQQYVKDRNVLKSPICGQWKTKK
jgi:hypothetical protein